MYVYIYILLTYIIYYAHNIQQTTYNIQHTTYNIQHIIHIHIPARVCVLAWVAANATGMSVCLLYWYKSTGTDAMSAASGSARVRSCWVAANATGMSV
jgi:hypothetical protein